MTRKISENVGGFRYEAGTSLLRLSECQYCEFGCLDCAVLVFPLFVGGLFVLARHVLKVT